MGIIKDPTSWRAGFELGLAGFSFPYSKPRKPTAYLYNGIRLPALPEWDREKYPYAMITFIDYESIMPDKAYVYFMRSITAERYESGDSSADEYYSDGVIFTERIRGITTRPASSQSDFPEFGGLEVQDNTTFVPLKNAVWSNTDIYKPDGTLYLAASEPVPVYE